MDIIEAIYQRRAVRDFTEEPVSKDAIRLVIAAAGQAPSAMNLQPWSFLVLEGRAELERYSGSAKAHLLETMAPESPLARYRGHLADPDFQIFYGAPALIVICATSAEAGDAEDCCLAAQNLMLAAHATGLGTCWIGFARPWLDLPQSKNELGVAAHHMPVAPIIIGHPKAPPVPVPRRQPDIRWIGGAEEFDRQ